MEAIRVENVSKDFPGTKALDNISFKVQKGSIHGFLGPNGAGKSTTIKIISGLIPASKGEIYISGLELDGHREEVRSKIGLLPENPPLYLNMSVKDYLRFVWQAHTFKKNPKSQHYDQTLTRCGLQEVQNRLIGNLSKGLRQRVGIAASLIYDPEIIILDEPTVGLDPKAIGEIRSLIQDLKKHHTILFSSHQLAEVEKICTDITVIHEGHILKSGPIEEIRRELQTKQIIRTELPRWNEGLKKLLFQKLSPFEIIEKGGQEVLFYFDGPQDVREKLICFLVENNCPPLEFAKQNYDLEELFSLITSGRKQ